MNRRSFLGIAASVAPMIFVPQLIQPVWSKVILPEKHFVWILDWTFVQDKLGGCSLEAAVKHVDIAGLGKSYDPWRQFIRLTPKEASDWAKMLGLTRGDVDKICVPSELAKLKVHSGPSPWKKYVLSPGTTP